MYVGSTDAQALATARRNRGMLTARLSVEDEEEDDDDVVDRGPVGIRT